jgi:hypothetical protein
MAALDDLLVLQPELVSHLAQALRDIRPAVHILTPSDLASETDTGKAGVKPQPVPAINIVYLGHRFSSEADRQRYDGRALLLQQLFVAEVVTRNVRSLKSGASARSEGGQLAARVLTALMGARLPSAASPLRLKPGPGPLYQDGMQYIPLAFDVDLMVRSA